MTTLHIDFETRSTVDLPKTGVYVYAAHPSTDVICAAYAVDDGPVQLWTPGMEMPDEIRNMAAEGWTVVAHNAAFERAIWQGVMFRKHAWHRPQLHQWRCTMVQAYAMSLPGSLANAAAALGLDIGKDMGGRDLMLRMSKPRKARKGELPNGLYWHEDDERKQRLYDYCRQDVEVERALDKRLLALSPSEQRLWQLDQVINDRGVYVDRPLCTAALKVVSTATGWLNNEMCELTGGAVQATTNIVQLTMWLREQQVNVVSLDKEAIDGLLLQCKTALQHERTDADRAKILLVKRVLEIRREAAKAAVKKIDALVKGTNDDGRARGLLQFHAAGTGRWAGRRFQPQNIKRPELKNVDDAIRVVESGDADYVSLVCGEPLAVVGDCLRGLVRAKPGNSLFAADFSNIEGRVIAWLAGEEWKLQAFRDFDRGVGPDIYKLAYSRSFGVAANLVDDKQRQVGKVMELALGFQGGVGAFQAMSGTYGVDVTDERADELKQMWRDVHPNVVQFWYDLESAAKQAVQNRGKIFQCGRIAFRTAGSFLFMRLPSGRSICYPYPCIKDKMMPWGEMRPQLCYQGTDTYTRKWGDCFAHGGLLFNNAVQGTARDIEAEAMTRCEDAGYSVVLTVHDEVVSETPKGFGSVEQFEKLMIELPTWATGLPVAAGAWTAERYRK